jgi:hypothetical protein
MVQKKRHDGDINKIPEPEAVKHDEQPIPEINQRILYIDHVRSSPLRK